VFKARRADAARELSALLQTGYADVQRDDLVARERQQISTDSLINLPASGWPTVRARIRSSRRPRRWTSPTPTSRSCTAHPLTPTSLPVAYRSTGKETHDGLGDETRRGRIPPALTSARTSLRRDRDRPLLVSASIAHNRGAIETATECAHIVETGDNPVRRVRRVSGCGVCAWSRADDLLSCAPAARRRPARARDARPDPGRRALHPGVRALRTCDWRASWGSATRIRKVRRGEILARRRNAVARVAPITLYVLAGPRVSEGCDLDGVHLDLAGGRVHVPGTKTSAGDRWVPLLPAARERLIAHKLEFPFGPRDPVFATRNDRRNTPNNVTKTILNPAVERANALLEADGREPIAALTMHSLRRTFATILAVCEVTQFRAKYLVGHEDDELTAKVYQQHIEVPDEDLDALERVMGCTIEDAYETFGGALRRRSRRRVSASNLHSDEKQAPAAPDRSGQVA
jgi:integrase